MSLGKLFAPLMRAVRHRPVLAQRWQRNTLELDEAWYTLLGELRLPDHTFADVLARESLAPHFHYRHFTKAKTNGARRQLAEPDVKLKRLQQEIHRLYLVPMSVHDAATAYRPKRSIADHVWPHAGSELIITADILDFFPNTSTWRVEHWWRNHVNDATARLLTLLTTHQNCLPQGAPTSPALSNLLNVDLDARLTTHVQASHGRYTRYCDDMVFSWGRYAHPPADFDRRVAGVLHEYGYSLHPDKGWHVFARGDEPTITGVVLTKRGGVRLPDVLYEKMAALQQSDDLRDQQRLAGYRGYEAMVRSENSLKTYRKT